MKRKRGLRWKICRRKAYLSRDPDQRAVVPRSRADFSDPRRGSRLAVVDWDYNAWGGKYPPCDLDEVVPTRVAEKLGLPVYYPRMILEGGSIEVNGAGALLTTEGCLLNPNRNPQLRGGKSSSGCAIILGCAKFSGWAMASRATTPTGISTI